MSSSVVFLCHQGLGINMIQKLHWIAIFVIYAILLLAYPVASQQHPFTRAKMPSLNGALCLGHIPEVRSR